MRQCIDCEQYNNGCLIARYADDEACEYFKEEKDGKPV